MEVFRLLHDLHAALKCLQRNSIRSDRSRIECPIMYAPKFIIQITFILHILRIDRTPHSVLPRRNCTRIHTRTEKERQDKQQANKHTLVILTYLLKFSHHGNNI